jgi:hypothetical protein
MKLSKRRVVVAISPVSSAELSASTEVKWAVTDDDLLILRANDMPQRVASAVAGIGAATTFGRTHF